MTRYSRRTVVAVAAELLLAGCSETDPSTTETSTGDPAADGSATGTAGIETVEGEPSCGLLDADQLFTVRPKGGTILLTSEARADEVAEMLRTERGVDDELLTRRSYETDDGPRYAVEIDPGAGLESGTAEDLRGMDGVDVVRSGRSRPTVADVAAELRERVREDDEIRPSELTTRVVVPEPPEPIAAVAALSGVDSPSTLAGSGSFESRVATDDGERLLAESNGIVSAATTTMGGSRHGVELEFSASARDRYVATLEEAGALDRPREHPIRVYYEGERVWEGELNRNLATAMRDGDWDGSLLISVATEGQAAEIAAAVGLVSFSVPSAIAVEDCRGQ